MNKKNNQKKSASSERGTKLQEVQEAVVNTTTEKPTTDQSRRQKRNAKNQEKKQTRGESGLTRHQNRNAKNREESGPQTIVVNCNKPEKPKDAEKSVVREESWETVEHSSGRSRATDVERRSEFCRNKQPGKVADSSKMEDLETYNSNKAKEEDGNASREATDKDFDNFNSLYRERKLKEFVKVTEIEEDLFNMPPTFALAHCVAEDLCMGSGIAVQFSQQFQNRAELYQQKAKQGGMAILQLNGRFIYYLVTKRLSIGKPTTYTMWNSLQKLQQHMHKNKVKQLAIPRIGCGLDRLNWSLVKAMIEYTFRHTDAQIIVCNFQQAEEDTPQAPPTKLSKCPVKHVDYPLVDIEPFSAIIYFGTVSGHVSDEIQHLNNKFNITGDYLRARKSLGDVLQKNDSFREYCLLGCITRATEKDAFDFLGFQKCIDQMKKLHRYNYVAFQAFLDDKDDLIVDKIANMLRYSLRYVEVYVCWGGKMSNFMPFRRGGDNY